MNGTNTNVNGSGASFNCSTQFKNACLRVKTFVYGLYGVAVNRTSNYAEEMFTPCPTTTTTTTTITKTTKNPTTTTNGGSKFIIVLDVIFPPFLIKDSCPLNNFLNVLPCLPKTLRWL